MSIHKWSALSFLRKKIERKISRQEEECRCFSIEGNNNTAQTQRKTQHHQHRQAHHMLLNFFFLIFNFFSWWFNIKWNFWDFYDLSLWFWQLILLSGDNNVQIFISHQIPWQGSKIIGFLHSIFHHPIIDKKWWNELFDQAKKWSFIANLSFSINKIGNYLLPIESEIICNVILLTSSPQSDQANFKTFHKTFIRPIAGDCFSSPEH